MTDKPIIFSGPMVRALLEGRKTQTRRVLKPRGAAKNCGYTHLRLDVLDDALWWWDGKHDRVGASQPYPYAPGERLWVREGHALVPSSAYRMSDGVVQVADPTDPDRACVFRAGWERSKPGSWRSPIHMPRWASRLTLIVTDVRVQRLQEITPTDAISEGVEGMGQGKDVVPRDGWRMAFADLWCSIHGPGAWGENPWVAAISFDVVRRNIDEADQ